MSGGVLRYPDNSRKLLNLFPLSGAGLVYRAQELTLSLNFHLRFLIKAG